VDVNKSLPRFIELVLAPQERSEVDSVEVQRMALESLRQVRPGMLIDHIEESAGGTATGPIKLRPLFMRLRSHSEARTFDELRVYELGRLVRRDDPDWHEAVVELVYQARGILVDSTGLVADPASEGAGRQTRKPPRPQASRSSQPAPPSSSTSHGSGRAPSPPAIKTSTAPSWAGPSEATPSIELPKEHRPPALGRPAPPHTPVSAPRMPQAPARGAAPAPPSPARSVRAGQRFFALCEGRLFCPTCAQPMAVQSMGHERRSLYTCASRHLHPATDTQPEVFYPVDVVDQAVWERMASKLAEPAIALEIIKEAMSKGMASGEKSRAQAQARLERLERDEIEVLRLRSDDRISEGAARHRLDEIGKERRVLTQEIEEDRGAGSRFAPLSKALEQLQAFRERSGQASSEADFGLRRRLVEACVPQSAEHGIFPHADGTLELRDLLAELSLTPGLKHRARSLGRMVGTLRERVSQARPEPRSRPKLELPAPLASLLARLTPTATPRADTQDLGKALQASMLEHQPLVPHTPPSRTPWLAYGVLLVAAALVAVLFQPVKPQGIVYENRADDLGVQGKLSELHQVPGGWIGVTDPLWAGTKDKQVAMVLCDSLAAQLQPEPTETVMLMVPGGVPIAECRSPLADGRTSPPDRKAAGG
jgi:hypothetical protein